MKKILRDKRVLKFKDKKHKKHLSRKKILLIASAVFIVLLGAILAVAYLLPKTPSIRKNIVIGDITITPVQIDKYAKEVDKHRKEHPEVILEGDAKDIALEDLVMNAGLKMYAKKYNQTVSKLDILTTASADYIVATEQEAINDIPFRLGPTDSYLYVRTENMAYQSKLFNYVLLVKSLFYVSINFDAPYFYNIPKDQVQSAYDEAKLKLKNDYLPLFDAKSSKEEIAQNADMNLINPNNEVYNPETITSDEDLQIGGQHVAAKYYQYYRADGSFFSNINDNSYVLADLGGDLYNMDDKIAELKNVGDYSDVFASQTGEFAIIRLEDKNNGEFNSWQEMLKSLKEKYAYDKTSKIISDISYGTQAFVEDVSNKIALLNPDESVSADMAADCSHGPTKHHMHFHYRAYNGSNQISGATLKVFAHYNDNIGCDYNYFSQTLITGGYDDDTVGFSCNQGHLNYARTADPSGYKYLRTTSPEQSAPYSATGSNDIISSPSSAAGYHYDGTNGFPPFKVSTMNSAVEIYTNSFYDLIDSNWSVIPTISVDQKTVYPGEEITWTHNVKNATPTIPTTKIVNYSAQGDKSPSGSDTMPIGTKNGDSFSTSYTATSTDAGGPPICRHTDANPKNKNDNGTVSSSAACVNVIKETEPEPVPTQWDISTNTIFDLAYAFFNFSKGTAYPGEKVGFTHKIRNNGPDDTTLPVNWGYNTYVDGNLTETISHDTISAGLKRPGLWPLWYNWIHNFDSDYVVPNYPYGTKVCRATYAIPTSATNSNEYESNQKCITVTKQTWKNDVKIEVNKYEAWRGDTITWKHFVKNSGPDPTNSDVDYGYATSSTVDGIFADGFNSIGTLPSGAENAFFFTSLNAKKGNSTVVVPENAMDGQEICRSTYARPQSSDSNEAIISDMACVKMVNPINWEIKPTISATITPESGAAVTSPVVGPGVADTYNEVKVNGIVQWNHKIESVNIPGEEITPTDKAVVFGYDATGFSPATFDFAEKLNSGAVVGNSKTKTTKYQETSPFKLSSNDVGKFCRRTFARPGNEDGDTINSAYSCVELKYDYDLKPSIDFNVAGDVIEHGGKITVVPVVTNSGPTKSRPTDWKISKIVFAPSKDPTTKAFILTSGSSACNYYTDPTKYLECNEDFVSGSGTVFKTLSGILSGPVLSNGVFDVPDTLEPGTQICFALSVHYPSESDEASKYWGHSSLKCKMIIKKPKVQVLGGDLRVNGNVVTKQSMYPDVNYGSWAEYGILSNGSIKDMGSGTMLTGLNANKLPGICDYSVLSFNNINGGAGLVCTSGDIGKYDTTRTIPEITLESIIRSGYSEQIIGDTIDLSVGTGAYSLTGGTVYVDGATIGSGKWIIVNAPNSTVRIRSNISYSSETFGSIKDIPQVVIIAKNIDVYDSVTNIDAWLVAKGGYINTCSYQTSTGTLIPIGSSLTTDKCNSQLKINGPVIANKLWLQRTYGANYAFPGPGEPAEIINLRSDAYLWSYANASSSVNMQTVYTTELPARF